MDVKNLLSALEVLSIVANDDVMLFQDDELLTWSNEIFASYPLKCDVKGAVVFSKFASFVRSCKKDVLLSSDDSNIFLKSGGSKSRFVKKASSECPHDATMNLRSKDAAKVGKDFVDGLRFCSGIIDRDSVTPSLIGIYINGSLMIASDDTRIGFFKLNHIYPNILLPLQIVSEIVRLGDPVKLAVVGNYILLWFRSNGFLAVRSFGDDITFPKGWSGIEESEEWGKKFWKLPEAFNAALDRVSVFASGSTKLNMVADLEVDGSKVVLKSSSPFGGVEDMIKGDKSGNAANFKLVMNPTFMKHAIDNNCGLFLHSKEGNYITSDDRRRRIFMSEMGESS